MEHDKEAQRIPYVRPQALDLGPVTAAMGGTCTPTGNIPTGKPGCDPTGSWVSICQFGTNGSPTL